MDYTVTNAANCQRILVFLQFSYTTASTFTLPTCHCHGPQSSILKTDTMPNWLPIPTEGSALSRAAVTQKIGACGARGNGIELLKTG